MDSIVVIPARYASTRLPGKPLALIAGKPMIQHVYERACRARCARRVIVATDDDRILEAVRAFGGEGVLTSSAHPSGTDRVAEVVRGLACEIVVNVQGDEPMIEPSALDEASAPLETDPDIPMGTLKTPLTGPEELADPSVVKVVTDRAGNALYFSRSPIPYPRETSGAWRPDGPYYRHIGLYAYRREFLLRFASMPQTQLEKAESLEQLRALENGYRIRVSSTPHRSLAVDTPEELERVRALVDGRDRGRSTA